MNYYTVRNPTLVMFVIKEIESVIRILHNYWGKMSTSLIPCCSD